MVSDLIVVVVDNFYFNTRTLSGLRGVPSSGVI